MIVVRRIAGESFDLSTGEQVPKALILSNGQNEMAVPVTDEVVMELLKLMALTPEVSTPDFTATEPPPPAETKNPVLRVAPVVQEEPEDELGQYDDPETGTASI